MQQTFDRQETRMCAKGTLSGITRSGGLLMGAVLASMLLVDLPVPVGRADAPSAAPPFIPAADSWIRPGAASRHQAPYEAAVTPADPAQQRKLHRKSRAARDGIRPGPTRLSGGSEPRRKGV
jgi:hypothetical protein